jgi:HlyD family secretion protein
MGVGIRGGDEVNRRAIAVGLGVLILVILGLWARSRSATNPGPSEFSTLTVERGTVVLTVTADGTLQPKTTVNVKSYAGGNVDVLAVEVGDVVQKGDLIAKIDPTDSLSAYEQAVADLEAAKARLQQARDKANAQPAMTKAAIAQAGASHAAAAHDLTYLREAKHPQQRASAGSALDKAKANLDLAEIELSRMRELKGEGFVSQSDVDTALNRRDLAAAELASAQEQWDTLDRQLSSELKAAQARVVQTEAALERARVDAVQDRISQADVTGAQASVARAQAQLTEAQTTLDYTTITAPRDGVILQKFVEEGTIVTSGRSSVTEGTDIVLLGDVSEMVLEVSLDEADVGMVCVGQKAEITVDALPDDRFHGTIARIDPQAVTQQNVTTVLVTVRVDDADERLKPGMTAGCDFFVARAEDVLCLPNRAVEERRGQYSVQARQGEEVVPIPVEVGLIGDELTEIRNGLSEGQEVLLPGLGSPAQDRTDWARERGRRMGGAGGFVRSGG